MRLSIKSLPTGFLFLSLILSGTAVAQDPDAQAQGNEEPVFELSPFTVNTDGDRGYLATNAISGTSLNTQIRDLPMPLEVVNRELIEDLQANDLKEMLEYSAGVNTQSFQNNSGANPSPLNDNSPSSTNLNAAFTNTISIRGYTVPNNQRLGFRVGASVPKYNVLLGGSTDSISAERVEVVRGPQALLYGINVLSGVVNIIPKEPLFSQRTQLSLSTGSYDFLRSTLDTTGPIIKDKLAYRFIGAYTEEGHWTQWQETERKDFALQLKLRLSKAYEVFAEVKKSSFHRDGIGPKTINDNDSTGGYSQWRWTNEYGEQITFGRDNINALLTDDFGNTYDSAFVPRTDYTYPPKFSDLGNNFRISGPDTYFDREETTVTALLRANFTENLKGEFGTYFVSQDEETFNVDLRSFSGSRGAVRPQSVRPGSFGRPPVINDNQKIWFANPEVSMNGTIDPVDVAGDPVYNASQGVGQPFAFPRISPPSVVFPISQPVIVPAQPNDPDAYDRRFARYIWFNKPLSAESMQLRGRLVYDLESNIFGENALHSFSVGVNYIKDDIDHNINNVSAANDNNVYSSFAGDLSKSRQADDAYYFRSNPLDFTPLTYNGENLAIMHAANFNKLGNFSGGSSTGTGGGTIARSGSKHASLYYRGMYGLYHGRFFNERFHIIGGARRYQYQVKEWEDIVIGDQLRASDVWQGVVNPVTPWLIGTGVGPYVSPEGIPASLDARVALDYQKLQELQPEGTVEYNFADWQEFDTFTLGLSYRITDPLSVYFLFSEGVFPNTGQRDGLDNPIGAEQTINTEVGFKFEFLDGKISGTVSFYRIERENAVFSWGNAPAPSKWHGGVNAPVNAGEGNYFSPQNAAGSAPYKTGDYLPVTYGVAMEYVQQAFEQMGLTWPTPSNRNPTTQDFAAYGATGVESRAVPGSEIRGLSRIYAYVPYDALKTDPSAEVMKLAFDLAMLSQDPYGIPFMYNGVNEIYNNNPSNNNSLGSNILFDEVGTGVDGQIIFSPTPSYQILFGYSYQNREVQNLYLVDAVDPEGNNWGTEYDIWVYALGAENFSDPTRPSTFNGGSVKGLDFSFQPKLSMNLLNKYQFKDGPLKGLEVGLGVQYAGPSPTSVPIGGSTLAENRFRTPDTPERIEFDSFFNYRFRKWGVQWRVGLRINNLLDDTESLAIASYENQFGEEVLRRTRIFHAPRTWRLTVDASF